MKAHPQFRLAFSLIEVVIALGVTAISLFAIFGLLATGEQTNHTSVEQTASSDILAAVAADLRATPITAPRGQAAISQQFGINIPANPVSSPTPTPTTLYFNAQGHASTTLDATARYRLQVSFLPNSNARAATFVTLQMTWPAAAPTTAASTSSAEMFVALDRN